MSYNNVEQFMGVRNALVPHPPEKSILIILKKRLFPKAAKPISQEAVESVVFLEGGEPSENLRQPFNPSDPSKNNGRRLIINIIPKTEQPE